MKQEIGETDSLSDQIDQIDQVPEQFYRYRSFSNGSSEYLERSICHNELYFSSPSSFNDPFDCRPPMNFETTKKEFIALSKRHLALYKADLSPTKRRKEAERRYRDWKQKNQRPKAEREMYQTYSKIIDQSAGVLCLSLTNKHILMWSHYADSHRGVCLQFNGMSGYFARAQPIKYSLDRTAINPFRQEHDEILTTAILSKAKDWEYEEEWRIVDHEKGVGVQQFPSGLLTGVILGAKISEADEEKIRGWIEENKHPVRLFRARICEHSYSVHIDRER